MKKLCVSAPLREILTAIPLHCGRQRIGFPMLGGLARSLSALVLIVANLLPIHGVLNWGWDVVNIVLL